MIDKTILSRWFYKNWYFYLLNHFTHVNNKRVILFCECTMFLMVLVIWLKIYTKNVLVNPFSLKFFLRNSVQRKILFTLLKISKRYATSITNKQTKQTNLNNINTFTCCKMFIGKRCSSATHLINLYMCMYIISNFQI